MEKILVLGAGMVGRAMAIDLSTNYAVTVADISEEALLRLKSYKPAINIVILNVQDTFSLKKHLISYDIILSAVPGFLGFNTLKAILEAGKNVVDISFFPEDALELHDLAVQNKVTAIVDCGVAPGLDNLILGYYNTFWDITEFECLVGGLPKIKKWPFYYKAPFSPIDVIEEYTRPARLVENGHVVVREALSDCEYVDFEKVGTLESFNTDGLRSLIQTMQHIPNMKEKTLRYPGHVELIKALKAAGFFNRELIPSMHTSPIDFTSKVLFESWKLGENEPELTLMRVRIAGSEHKPSTNQEVIFELYDEFCSSTQTSSMARTTGYTATAAVNLLLAGKFSAYGVFPPELVGKHPECHHFIINYLKERNIRLEVRVQ